VQFLKENWLWILGPIVIVLGLLLWFVWTQDGSVAEFDYAIQ
jgi:hypothetical protein